MKCNKEHVSRYRIHWCRSPHIREWTIWKGNELIFIEFKGKVGKLTAFFYSTQHSSFRLDNGGRSPALFKRCRRCVFVCQRRLLVPQIIGFMGCRWGCFSISLFCSSPIGPCFKASLYTLPPRSHQSKQATFSLGQQALSVS